MPGTGCVCFLPTSCRSRSMIDALMQRFRKLLDMWSLALLSRGAMLMWPVIRQPAAMSAKVTASFDSVLMVTVNAG